MTPFIDTRDEARLNFALNLLNYPDQFCLKPSNQVHLAELLPATEPVRLLVGTLKAAQAALARFLPLPQSAWDRRGSLPPACVPITTCERAGVPGLVEAMAESLDRCLLESAVSRMADDNLGPLNMEGLTLALQCVWLSEHLALVALGIAAVERGSDGELIVTPASSDSRSHLRRLWFATAFEAMSLRKAQASLETYTMVCTKQLAGDPAFAFADALSIIPQHWRLPANVGPVADLLLGTLRPLVWLAGAVMHAANSLGGRPLRRENLPANPDIRKVYDDVVRLQSRMPRIDRLFDVRDGGLILGQRRVASGLLLLAEEFAKERLGAHWHYKSLSNVQKGYLIGRLQRLEAVDVIDVEVGQGDTTDDVHVDVDLFVRDRRHHILFAVQLKHFEFSQKSGIRGWLERLRPGRMSYGLAQLQAIRDLASNDPKVRAKLINHGISRAELTRVVPVVLHNVGVLDFLQFQGEVLVYDQQTFVNVLDGRSAGGVGAANGVAVHQTMGGASFGCRLDEPESVIDAYVADPQFKALAHFDAAADTCRQFAVLGTVVKSCGLGI